MAIKAEDVEYETKFIQLKIDNKGFESLTKEELGFYRYEMAKGPCHVCGSEGTDDINIIIQDKKDG